MLYFTQTEIDRFIEEDLPYHDETSHALGIDARPGELSFTAKREGFVLSGCEEAVRIALSLGRRWNISGRVGVGSGRGRRFWSCAVRRACCIGRGKLA